MARKKENLTSAERLEEALVPEGEQPYPVPGNWCWMRGRAFLKPMETKRPEGEVFRYIDIDSIDNKRQQVTEPKNLQVKDAPSRASRKLRTGDTVFSMVRPYLMNIAYIDETISNSIASTGFYVCTPTENVNSLYLYYLMTSPYTVDGLNRYMKGDNSPSIRKDDIENYVYPIPPLPEQQRIVNRIESLFAKLDEAKQKAQDALDSFEPRKAAILHKAFTGELTAQWRKEHGVGMKSWENLRLENLIEGGPQNGLYKPQTAYGTGTKILRIDCFYEGAVLPWENLKRLALSKNEIEQYHLNINDIVINRVNSMAYLGKSALIRELPEECVFESNMMRITLNTRMVIPEYAIKYLNSVIGVQELRKNAKQAVNQASINQQDVKNVAIKLPKLDEQAEIVRILDDLLAKEQQAKEAAEGVLEQIDLIKKAILARAFRGELGTNDPSEESAVELVKRVLAVEPPPKARAKAVSIPREVEKQLKCELERKIMKLYYYSDSRSLPINTLMEVSSKKFEVLESIRNLEQRGIIKKLPNGNYKLVR